MGIVQELQLKKPETLDKKQFRCGQQVMLRTGGPGLTVRSVTQQSKGPWLITVDWFNEGEDRRQDYFSDQLVPWEGEDESEPEAAND